MASKKTVSTPNAPKPVGPYSQAVCVNGWLFVSGQIPIDPATGEMVEGEFEAAARRALENIKAIVEAAGGKMDDIVKVTVYLRDISKFSVFNKIYEEFFEREYPARVVIGVAQLPKNADIEVEAIARIDNCKS